MTDLEFILQRGRDELAAKKRAEAREAERIEAEYQTALEVVRLAAIAPLPPELGRWVKLDDCDLGRAFAVIALPGLPLIRFSLYSTGDGWKSRQYYQVDGAGGSDNVWVAVGMAAEKADRLGRTAEVRSE